MKQSYPRIGTRIVAFFFTSTLLLPFVGRTAHVPESVALQVGGHFFATPSIGRVGAELTLAYVASIGSDEESRTSFYVFNESGGGFVIIAGDDVVQPVLAYSTNRVFDPNDIPINVAKWLEGYKAEIRAAILSGIGTDEEIVRAWQSLLGEEAIHDQQREQRSVNPLLQTTWNQSPYYNALCPGGSVTGCVATAMAQIMKYWSYPANGSGFHQYNHPQYGTQSANFGGSTYQWGAMPNAVSSSNSAVATLMYHCGVSVDMQYSPNVSGAWVIEDHSPSTDHNAEYALKTYFGYLPSLNGVSRSSYDQAQWIGLLRTELDAGRPILHDGFGDGGGHAFVCDGYDDNNFFHFNWGWNGAYDGYFTVNALDPAGTGTGGGSGGYNSGQEAIIGIQPPTGSTTYDMALYDFVTPTSFTLYYGQAFSVTTNIVNNGTSTFNGDYCAGAFDSNGNFVGYVETLTGYTLEAGFVYTDGLTFSTTGMFGMVPGTYSIGIFHRPIGGNWVQVADNGAYTNLPQVTVVNENDIALNSNLVVTPSGNVVQGGQLSVNLNIVNDGVNTFLGDYAVALFNLDGSWAQDIGTITEDAGLPSGYTYLDPYLTFGPVAITVSPGTYLLAVEHNPNASGWQLTGSGSFTNPITVTVVAPPFSADVFEVNNTPGQSYMLPVNFSGNNAASSTNGSNLHITSDLDHYKIVLPAGYDYAITARLHDAYNSGNGTTYSADGLFSWSSDGTNWSSTFDDVMPNNIAANNGGTIYFRVAPFFAGEIGTYLLQLNLIRSPLVGIEEGEVHRMMKVYPNPAIEFVQIDLGADPGKVERIVLMDDRGVIVKDLQKGVLSSGAMSLSLSNIADGCYHLQVRTDRGSMSQRVIIER